MADERRSQAAGRCRRPVPRGATPGRPHVTGGATDGLRGSGPRATSVHGDLDGQHTLPRLCGLGRRPTGRGAGCAGGGRADTLPDDAPAHALARSVAAALPLSRQQAQGIVPQNRNSAGSKPDRGEREPGVQKERHAYGPGRRGRGATPPECAGARRRPALRGSADRAPGPQRGRGSALWLGGAG